LHFSKKQINKTKKQNKTKTNKQTNKQKNKKKEKLINIVEHFLGLILSHYSRNFESRILSNKLHKLESLKSWSSLLLHWM